METCVLWGGTAEMDLLVTDTCLSGGTLFRYYISALGYSSDDAAVKVNVRSIFVAYSVCSWISRLFLLFREMNKIVGESLTDQR